jgi:thiopeptide-type bacteriocin biosynthesis protein
VTILESLEGEYDLDVRIRIGIVGADRVFRDCKLGLPERLALTRRVRDAFARELQLNSAQMRSLGERFRIQRQILESLVDETMNPKQEDVPAQVWAAYHARSLAVAEAMQRLVELERTDPASLNISDFAASCAHMHINRLMRSHARHHEAVVYDFLARIYGTMAAKRHITGDSLRK